MDPNAGWWDEAAQLTARFESTGTLKPIAHGVFTNNSKKSDKIYFNATERGVARLFTLMYDYQPRAGSITYAYLFSVNGVPRDVASAQQIAHSLTQKQLEMLHRNILSFELKLLDDPSTKYQDDLRALLAVRALFNRAWPEVVFAHESCCSSAKDAAAQECRYVVWARTNGVLSLMPIEDEALEKILKKIR